jgi:hypothetical protein
MAIRIRPVDAIEVEFLREHIHRGKEYQKGRRDWLSRNDVHVLLEARAVRIVPAIDPPKTVPPEPPK